MNLLFGEGDFSGAGNEHFFIAGWDYPPSKMFPTKVWGKGQCSSYIVGVNKLD